MSAVKCPFKPVAQRVVVHEPHEHQFLGEVALGNGLFVQDCGCGYRRRARKGTHGHIMEVFEDGMVEGGTSVDNSIFLKNEDGLFVNRWQSNS